MPVTIAHKTQARGSTKIERTAFPDEAALEAALLAAPQFLDSVLRKRVEVVGQQMTLPTAESGKTQVLDLLFLGDDLCLQLVEVKLSKNVQSHREIVAQALEYLASISELSLDRLDEISKDGLTRAIAKLGVEGEAQDAIDSRWGDCARQLEQALTRFTLVLDEVPPRLEHLSRFAQRLGLPISIVEVERFMLPDHAECFVATPTLQERRVERERGRGPAAPSPVEVEAISKAVELLTNVPIPGLGLKYVKPNCWKLLVPGWPKSVHYEILRRKSRIHIELHNESEKETFLKANLQAIASTIGEISGNAIDYDPDWQIGGLIGFGVPLDAEPQDIADGMRRFVEATKDKVQEMVAHV